MRRVRPPTRVNNACDRCRRHKQRCDDFRPCSNCLHAQIECIQSSLTPPVKRARTSASSDSRKSGTDVSRSLVNIAPVPPLRESSRDGHARAVSLTPQNEVVGRPPAVQLQVSPGGMHDGRREQSVLADLGGSESAMDITKKILGYASSPAATERATFAIPGGDSNRTVDLTSSFGTLQPISEILGIDLPSRQVSDALMDTYFCTVHWFSLVLYEPKFRERYTRIVDRGLAYPSDRAFLLLLSMVMVMGCWYAPGILPSEIASTDDLNNTRRVFLKLVSQSFMDLIDEDCLEFVQLCTLLGSYWLYWGRPKASFSILGAATKSAQAIELHRDSDKRMSSRDAEERKRVWWTIYTWDRFATIIYGRPLGINDKDCNVSMPASYPEDITFTPGDLPTRVSLSPYQIQLNRIYQITSPLLENIYGIRYSTDRSLRSQMPSMVSKIDQLMSAWQDDLPPHLHLGRHDDISLTSSVEEKMHRLQGLSLQLTYDNLMIVIHRPLLADQSRRRSRVRKSRTGQPTTSTENPDGAQDTIQTHELSLQQCLNSAMRISRIQQVNRNLLALARRTHLVSFIGMNLFTSSVVMFICALSDTLSDVAQEAKRGMARNLKMLKLMSGDGSLSMQCSKILEDLVQKIIDQEKEEMLRSVPSDDEMAPLVPTRRNSYMEGNPAVVGVGTGSHMTWLPTDELEASHHHQHHHQNNGNNSGNGGLSMQQTMASLQQVFKDVSIPRINYTASVFENELSNRRHITSQPMQQQGTRPDTFVFDGSNFNTEDLGQFWLWNMDPHMDESASWQSADEYT